MTSELTQPADQAGAETLETMALARRYNRWQYEMVAPYLGKRICELGSGIGNMSELILETNPELLVVSDTEPFYLARLRERFRERPTVRVEHLELPDASAHGRLGGLGIDTVIALNVFEHIRDDLGALKTARDLIVGPGRVILLVPAVKSLYGSLDVELGHHRRYTAEAVRALFGNAGMRLEALRYFNLVGCLGWWFNARVVRSRRIPRSQLQFFDRLVPLLRLESVLELPVGQSLIAVGHGS